MIVFVYFRPPIDHALHPYADRFGGEPLDRNQPLRARQGLARRQYTSDREALGRSHTDAEAFGGLRKTYHLAASIGGAVFGQAKTFAHFAHPDRRPGLTVAGFATHPVERHSEFAVRPMTGKFAERIDGGGRHVARIPARLDARDANFGMAATGPMDQQHSFVGGFVELADDLLNHDMDQTLLGARVGRGGIPSRWQIVGKLKKKRAIDLWRRRRRGAQLLDAMLQLRHALQRAVPAASSSRAT